MQANPYQSKPSSKFYGLFQFIFDHYNFQLFNGDIKDCVLVITRKNNVMGHYSYQKWFHMDDQETDELAINPSMFTRFPLLEICQTIVHEMCHGWQYHYGNPSERNYHNREWADKMISIGLMPSSTGNPGGKEVGQKMSDYPVKSGAFIKASEELINSDVFAGLFYEVSPDMIALIDHDKPLFEQIKDYVIDQENNPQKPRKSKLKYSCSCSNVWGKPGLEMMCKSCGEDFTTKS